LAPGFLAEPLVSDVTIFAAGAGLSMLTNGTAQTLDLNPSDPNTPSFDNLANEAWLVCGEQIPRSSSGTITTSERALSSRRENVDNP